MAAATVARTSFRRASFFRRRFTDRNRVEGFFHDSPTVVRSYLTQVNEVPLGSSGGVLERPCTLILAEDAGVIHGAGVRASSASGSWHDTYCHTVPNDYGIPYAQWSISEQNDQMLYSFDAALTEMKKDLGGSNNLQQPVLVARGPWMSWMAQFYLESLPLSGLVMVDPLLFNDDDDDNSACRLYERLYKRHVHSGDDRPMPEHIVSREYALFQDYVNHWDHWSLKLEPGVIPMMVLVSSATGLAPSEGSSSSSEAVLWQRHAEATAARHSSPESGPVPVVEIDASNRGECVRTVCSWIEEEVL